MQALSHIIFLLQYNEFQPAHKNQKEILERDTAVRRTSVLLKTLSVTFYEIHPLSLCCHWTAIIQ